MPASLITATKFHSTLADGSDNAAGKVYTYAAGTLTPQATYTTSAMTTPNSNPIILDGSGRASVWLDPSLSYKFVIQDASGAATPDGTVDNITDQGGKLIGDLASYTNATKGAALVGFDTDLAYAANTVGRSLRAVRNILEDGTVDSSGVTACSTAINTLIASGGEWIFPAGTYLFDSTVDLPDNTVLRFLSGAIMKPASNGLVMFQCKNYSGTRRSFFTKIIEPYVDANGKTGVVPFNMIGWRHAAAMVRPIFIGAFDHCIKLTELCWDCVIDEPFAQGCVNGILIGHGSNAVQVRKPGIDGLGSAGYGIKLIGGASYPTTSNTIQGGYIQGFSGVGGVGVWDSGAGTVYGVYGTTFDHVYFELNNFADIYFDTSYYGRAICCEHYVNGTGQNANYGRNNVGVRVEAPMMTSGARSIGLYNFDTSNRNCFGDMTTDVISGINLPLGTVSGIGIIPTGEDGTFTPTVRGSTLAGSGATIDAASRCTWSRNGKTVNLKGYVKWTTLAGATGNLNILGAPVALVPSSYTPTGIGSVIALQTWANQDMVCSLSGTGTTIQFLQVSTAGTFTPLAVTAAGEIYFDITYTL